MLRGEIHRALLAFGLLPPFSLEVESRCGQLCSGLGPFNLTRMTSTDIVRLQLSWMYEDTTLLVVVLQLIPFLALQRLRFVPSPLSHRLELRCRSFSFAYLQAYLQ
jgi:hypothetical protein